MNEQLKPYKTVEQIAKKHRLDVSFIQKQLDMGAPIEHEHTKDKDLATDIALQHLDEIPDYYTRLKKMESDAKKHHKKFKDVKEHCGCEDDAVQELESGLKKLDDTSYGSIDSLMRKIMKKHDMSAKQLHNAFVNKHDKTPDDWINEGTLHHWFRGSKSKDGKPGWVKPDGSPCANEPGETKTPKCFSSGRLRALKRKGKKGLALIRSAVRRKREKDKSQQQKTGASAPTNVPTFAKGKKDKNYIKAEPGIREAMKLNEAQKDKPGKGSGTKDACYNKVKSRYDVWPSAYASGALVKCRKVGAANWGTKSEDFIMDEAKKCWKRYKKTGTQKLFGKTYNRCEKTNEEVEMKRYCPKCAKEETRDECKYGQKYWDMFSRPITLGKDYTPNTPHPGNFPESFDHKIVKGILKGSDPKTQIRKSSGAGALTPDAAQQLGPKAVELQKKKAAAVKLPKLREENVTIEDADGNTFIEIIDLIKPEPSAKALLQAGKHRTDESKTLSQFMSEASAAWQRKEGKNPEGGLNKKGIASYRKENPGSNLSLAVTTKPSKLKKGSKSANRRKSFCSRMSGMKKKLTSAKTANDPNSRINKSLRKWNC